MMMTHAKPDENLLLLLRQGNRKAYSEIYERNKNAVYRYCYRMLSDAPSAEDATQDTFMKMYNNIYQLKNDSSLLPWLLRIARNEILLHIRRNKHNGTIDADRIWDEQTPHTIAETIESHEIVQHLLAQLRSEYREVLVLREYEQLSYQQIAEITGDTESSVKSRLFKARQALTKKLKAYYQ
jgi:RNA polymerase sigma-70 factor, ECF subfamily